MANNSYTLRFSDPANTGTIEVLGTTIGPGKNNYSTSLDLVGPGYTNYGLDTAQNFLKLLENFSGPNPPTNAIKGQLWYDTSNPNRKVLRVNNGDITSNRWPAASGIYQQHGDPSLSYSSGVTIGDIWVDTASDQLKIRNATGWTTVGPPIESGSSKSGPEVVRLQTNTSTSVTYPVILNWANGRVVEIISANEFTPRSVIDGFAIIKAGTNLTSRIPARYNGVAESAASLYLSPTQTLKASDVLKNKSQFTPQIHTGTFIIESSGGLQIRKDSQTGSKAIKIYSTASQAFVTYANTATSSMKVGIRDDFFDKSYILFSSGGSIGVNNENPSATFDVTGSGKFSGSLSITSTASQALLVGGGATFSKPITVDALTVTNTSILSKTVYLGQVGGSGTILEPLENDSYELGSPTKAFRHLYVSVIGTTGTTITIYGTVSRAIELASSRTFAVSGQIATTSPIPFNGLGNVVMNTTATSSLISQQPATSITTETQTLLVLNTSSGSTVGLEKISKKDFLADVYSQVFQPGMIIPWGRSTPPSEIKDDGQPAWLLCNGATTSTALQGSLWNIIGYTYGGGAGNFNVPNMTGVTTATNGPIYYIIKT